MKQIKSNKPKNTDPKKSKSIALLAKNIKYFRRQQSISQEYLAELSDLHRNYVGQIERSEVNISLMNLEAIAKALNVARLKIKLQHLSTGVFSSWNFHFYDLYNS